MTWLLDTNVLIEARRGRPVEVRNRLAARDPGDLAISAITIAELWYGAAKSNDPEASRAVWRRFLEDWSVLPFDREAAEYHGELRHALRRELIGERDLLIACVALANELTLVTANVREFGRVPGLRVEDWSR